MTTSQIRHALAAHLLAGDTEAARELAAGLSHAQLAELVLDLATGFAGGALAAAEAAGMTPEGAREFMIRQNRAYAHAEAITGMGN
jgi:hypothetical protein